MARPTKWRRIDNVPSVLNFVPSDKTPVFDKNTMKLEELEAIRLKDLEGLEQEECAGKMGVSRPTFQRILNSARGKIADSLINGKAITVEGGTFTRNICSVRCLDCNKVWPESFERMEVMDNGNYACPACGSTQVICEQEHGGRFCHRHCRRHGCAE